MASRRNGPIPDPTSRRILEEMREMRVEMREMRGEMREMRIEAREDRRRSDQRFEQVIREFREDAARRDAVMAKTLRDIGKVGVAIVRTLNHHTRLLEHISTHHGRLLERIDRKLGARDNGRSGNPRH